MKQIVVALGIMFNVMSLMGQTYVTYNEAKINRIDNSGLRQGVWDFYDEQSGIRVSTRIKDDVAGDTIFFFRNGALKFTYIKSKSDTTKYFIDDDGLVCNGYFTLHDIFYCKDDSVTKKKIEKYIFCDIFPFYYGGNEALYDYIRMKMGKAPKGELGKIKVGFMLDNAGRPTEVKINESDNPHLNEFCLKIIKEMPRWQAGYQGGAIVKVPMVIPLVFK